MPHTLQLDPSIHHARDSPTIAARSAAAHSAAHSTRSRSPSHRSRPPPGAAPSAATDVELPPRARAVFLGAARRLLAAHLPPQARPPRGQAPHASSSAAPPVAATLTLTLGETAAAAAATAAEAVAAVEEEEEEEERASAALLEPSSSSSLVVAAPPFGGVDGGAAALQTLSHAVELPALAAAVGDDDALVVGVTRSKWPSWRGHSWPPRALQAASEGLGLAF